MNRKTPHPKNIYGKPEKPPRQPAVDQEFAGYDAAGKPFFRRKASAIPGPRAGKSSAKRNPR